MVVTGKVNKVESCIIIQLIWVNIILKLRFHEMLRTNSILENNGVMFDDVSFKVPAENVSYCIGDLGCVDLKHVFYRSPSLAFQSIIFHFLNNYFHFTEKGLIFFNVLSNLTGNYNYIGMHSIIYGWVIIRKKS